MFETRGNRKQLNATSSMDPGMEDSCRIFKIQRGREGAGGRQLGVREEGGGERERVSLRVEKGVGGTGGTSEPGNKVWRSESLTAPGASRNLGIPTSSFRTCFPVHRKRGGRSYARRRTRGEVARTRRRRSGVARRRRKRR